MSKKISPHPIILLDSDYIGHWGSWGPFVTATKNDWEVFFNKKNINYRTIELRGKSTVVPIKQLRKSTDIIIPLKSGKITKALIRLRKLGYTGRFLIHDTMDANFITNNYLRLYSYLRPQDQVIMQSQSQHSIAKLTFAKGNFSVHRPNIQVPKSKAVKKSNDLVYFGRISAQKNLHTLILSLLWLPRAHLTIIGNPDSLGVLQTGVVGNKNNYKKFLKQLIKKFSLQKQVTFTKALPRKKLLTILKDQSFVFVSPTLHFDENLCTSAVESALLSRSAVVSHWGGLRDLANEFPKLVTTVPVDPGPCLNPYSFALAIKKVLKEKKKMPQNGKTKILSLNKIWNKNHNKGHRWGFSRFALKQLLQHKVQLNNNPYRVFLSAQDPLCQIYYKKMGMLTKPKVTKGSNLYLFPWVEIKNKAFHRHDRILGDFQINQDCKDLTKLLVRHGFAFYAAKGTPKGPLQSV